MNKTESFKPGELIVYQCGERYEVGRIKSISGNHAFVWYSSGETAANTPIESMHRIENADCLGETLLGFATHQTGIQARLEAAIEFSGISYKQLAADISETIATYTEKKQSFSADDLKRMITGEKPINAFVIAEIIRLTGSDPDMIFDK